VAGLLSSSAEFFDHLKAAKKERKNYWTVSVLRLFYLVVASDQTNEHAFIFS
jgi:hypothetical protein